MTMKAYMTGVAYRDIRRSVATTAFVVGCALVFLAAVGVRHAAAYESEVNSTPTGMSCRACHGDDSTVASGTISPSRKGPHGGYTTGTSKCESCHYTHDAPTDNLLMPAQTVRATCELCHDGTGGRGVYGAIKARTGAEPAAIHRIDKTSEVPAGSTGGTTTMTFSGEDGALTCSDCHSPHDNNTVAPFIGDRLRNESDVLTATASNRLLKKNPGNGGVTVPVYGSSWCGSCHRGSVETTQHAGRMGNHSVETETADFSYSNIVRVDGVNTTDTVMGPLGGNNFGYVMPYPRSAQQAGRGAICQQCHEDARSVGDETTTSPTQIAPAEVFAVTAADGANAADNPRFQVFPHEGENPGFRLERGDDLCLNCHPR